MKINQIREIMITNMQASLKFIRPLLELSVQEMAELMGVTRQTINNLESNKSTMSVTQYIAICAVIDNRSKGNCEVLRAINAIIKANSTQNIDIDLSELYNGLFLEKWFLTFPEYKMEIEDEIAEWSKLDQGLLEKLASSYKVLINYDSLMMEDAEVFFKRFAKVLKKYQSKMIIPFRVIENIQELSKDENNKSSIQARNTIKYIAQLQAKEVIEIRGEKDDPKNPDDLLIDVYKRYVGEYNVAIITQNAYLAHVIMSIESSNILNLLCKINSMNELNIWDTEGLDDYVEHLAETYDATSEQLPGEGWDML
ncbi:MAG: helix-turn-helix domain-containing protein [Romboutsia sp.]